MSEKETALQPFNSSELDLIKRTVAKEATDDELKMFLYVAGKRGLNPLTRQIYFVKYGSQHVMQTSIDGFRLIADRTGKYSPSPKPTLYAYDKNGNLFSATVFGMKLVAGQFIEFSATAHYAEYKVDTNSLWKSKPHVMLEKCAESKLLRRGFPEELSGLYTDDEMSQGAVINGQATVMSAEISPGKDTGKGNLPPAGLIPQESSTSEKLDNPNPLVEALKARGATEITDQFPLIKSIFGFTLTDCIYHGHVWGPGKYGVWHSDPQCSLSGRIKEAAIKVVKEKLGFEAFDEPITGKDGKKKQYVHAEFTEFLKTNKGIDGWGKLKDSPDVQMSILEELLEMKGI